MLVLQVAAAVEIHATDPAPASAPASAHTCDRMELEGLAGLAAEVEADEAAGRQDTAVVGRPSSSKAAAAVAKAPAGSPLVRSHVHCRCRRRRHRGHLGWRGCRVVVQEVAAAGGEGGSSSLGRLFRWKMR